MSNVKRILITGNMGYIGPVLTSYLRSVHDGLKIYGVDLGFFGQCLTGADVIPESRIDIQYTSDVRNFPVELLKDTDVLSNSLQCEKLVRVS